MGVSLWKSIALGGKDLDYLKHGYSNLLNRNGECHSPWKANTTRVRLVEITKTE